MKCACYRCGALDQQPDAKFCHVCGSFMLPTGVGGITANMPTPVGFADFSRAVAIKTGAPQPATASMSDCIRSLVAAAIRRGVQPPDNNADVFRFLREIGVKTGVTPSADLLRALLEVSSPPPADRFTANNLEIFESADHFLQPTFGTCFYHDHVRRINFKIHFTRISNVKTNATLHWEIFDANRKYITQQKQTLTLYPTVSQIDSVCFGWGNAQPGSWSAGTYTVRARIENSNTIEGVFTLV